MTYDAERRLTSWQDAPTNPTSQAWFMYDGEGHRVEQYVSGGSGNHTYYLPGNVEEVMPSGSLIKYYTAGGLTLGVNTASDASGSGISYLLSDGLGSVTEALSQTGMATGAQLYSPYGGVRYSSGTLPTAKGFTGQYSDAASTGLDYYGARYYDPTLGQFTSADTVNDGLNRYAYVKGNPTTYTDPTGHRPCMDEGICRGAVTATNTVLQSASLHAALWARYLRNTGEAAPLIITVTHVKYVAYPDHNLPGGLPNYRPYTTAETKENPFIKTALETSDRFNKLGLALTGTGFLLDGIVSGRDYADAHPHAAGWKPWAYGVFHSLVATGITAVAGAIGEAGGAEGIVAATMVTTALSSQIDDLADTYATMNVNEMQEVGDTAVKMASDYGTYASANLPFHVQVNFGPISFMTGTESSWP